MTVSKQSSRLGTVLRVTSGNFLEMFDFFLVGIYANNISKTFFPSNNEVASLMLTFMTFGAGFLMRPLGAIGPDGDRKARLQPALDPFLKGCDAQESPYVLVILG